MEDESGVAGLASSTQDLRFILFRFLPRILLHASTIAVLLALAVGQGPRRAWRRLVSLIPLLGGASASAAAAISPSSPAPLLQSQLSTTQEELVSQQLAIEEELQPYQSAFEEGHEYQQSTTEEELHSPAQEELQSQLSATEEDLQSQQLATEEELQSAVQEGIMTEEGLHSTTEEELQSQWSATKEDVQFQRLATEEEPESAVQEDITTEELHLPTEEALHSQLSATEEDDLSQQLSTDEDLQSVVEEDIQDQLLPTREEILAVQEGIMSEEGLHSTTEEELQSPWSATVEDVQSQLLATEEELESAMQEDITTEELHLPTEEALHSQLSATEEDDLSRQAATDEDLQLVVVEDIQTQLLPTREEILAVQGRIMTEGLHSTTEEELQSPWSASAEDVQSQRLAIEEELLSAVQEGITTEELHLPAEVELHSQLSATEEDDLSQQAATDEDLQSVVEEDIQTQLLPTKEEIQAVQGGIMTEGLHSTTEEELQSPWSATEEDVHSQRLATEEELESVVQEDITTEELHLPTEEELHSQLSATEEDDLCQQVATEEDLQSVVEEDIQTQLLPTREEIQFATEEELDSQQSETAACAEDAMLHNSIHKVHIWNSSSLKQCLRNLIASCMKINYPIQIAAAHSPNGSSCSSPRHFDCTYRDALVNENNNDQCHQFKPLSLLDHGDIYLINDSSLLQIEDMILNNVFEDKSYVVDSFLSDVFKSVDLSIDALTLMVDYESAKRCVLNFKVTARLLCLMKSELDKVECVSFDQNLKDCYFTLCARGSIQKLIDAADSVSKLEWSASDSDIYQMLVLYEAIADVHGAFSYLNGSSRIFQQMQIYIEERFNRIFEQMQANFEGILYADLNSSCEITHDRHPMTNFLIHSMELFENHNSIVQHVCVGDAISSLGDLLLKVIRYWADKLKTASDSYAEGRKQIFLLNNLAPFAWEIKKPLQKIAPNVSDEIIEFLEFLINEYTTEYLSKCWGPVRNYVELSSGRKPRMSSLNKFSSEFQAILNCQGTWVLETNLKRKLREDIKNYITPYYCTFLQELQKKSRLRLFFCKYITPEQLDKRVDNLFESGL